MKTEETAVVKQIEGKPAKKFKFLIHFFKKIDKSHCIAPKKPKAAVSTRQTICFCRNSSGRYLKHLLKKSQCRKKTGRGPLVSPFFTSIKILVKCETRTHVHLLLRPQKIRIDFCAKWQQTSQVTKQHIIETLKPVCSSVLKIFKMSVL